MFFINKKFIFFIIISLVLITFIILSFLSFEKISILQVKLENQQELIIQKEKLNIEIETKFSEMSEILENHEKNISDIKQQIALGIIDNKKLQFTNNNDQEYINMINDYKHHSKDFPKLLLKKFTLPFLTSTGPPAYIFYHKENLYLITGSGKLMFISLDNIEKENFIFKIIDTNFQNIIGKDYLSEGNPIVKDLIIINNKLFLSYTKKITETCFKPAIFAASLNTERIIFNDFFIVDECQPYHDFRNAGTLSNYKDDKILYSIGDYGSYETQGKNSPQILNSLLGKIISIDINNKNFNILSMGHRNAQGIYYDSDNNVVYSTEHGP